MDAFERRFHEWHPWLRWIVVMSALGLQTRIVPKSIRGACNAYGQAL